MPTMIYDATTYSAKDMSVIVTEYVHIVCDIKKSKSQTDYKNYENFGLTKNDIKCVRSLENLHMKPNGIINDMYSLDRILDALEIIENNNAIVVVDNNENTDTTRKPDFMITDYNRGVPLKFIITRKTVEIIKGYVVDEMKSIVANKDESDIKKIIKTTDELLDQAEMYQAEMYQASKNNNALKCSQNSHSGCGTYGTYGLCITYNACHANTDNTTNEKYQLLHTLLDNDRKTRELKFAGILDKQNTPNNTGSCCACTIL